MANQSGQGSITLRPWQEEAVEALMEALARKRAVLMQAPTGSGKTVVLAEIVRRHLSGWPGMKVCVASHRAGLIVQTIERLKAYWPAGAPLVDMACASRGRVETGGRVVVGTVQTLARRRFGEPFDLIIVDEAHRIPPEGLKSQYWRLFRRHAAGNPDLRILGVTATPYRLGHGYIYGTECRPDAVNLFSALDFQKSMAELTELGLLAPWRAKQPVDIAADLKRIRTRNGEYSDPQLTELLIREKNMRSAVDAWERYGEGRRHCLVFAVTIEHAERLAGFFRENGLEAAVVHSRMAEADRAAALEAFTGGRAGFLVSVGVLTEGWDCPQVDLVILCRPTKSPALFVQMIGRGSRPAPGKRDVLILDMVNNFREHGDPAAPEVRWRRGGAEGEAPVKVCPKCHEVNALGRRECSYCGWLFAPEGGEARELDKAPAMEEVAFGRKRAPRPPDGWEEARVLGTAVFAHVVRSAVNFGKRMLCMRIFFEGGRAVNVFLDVEGRISGPAWARAMALWSFLTGNSRPPASVDEACLRKREVKVPWTLKVNFRRRFQEIEEFRRVEAGERPVNPRIPMRLVRGRR
jgi:DNA repair protein RadD